MGRARVRDGFDAAAGEALRRLLAATGVDALVVVAASSRDADVAPFVGEAHLGDCWVVQAVEGDPHLGYLTDMERSEAASTGLAVIDPAALGVRGLTQSGASAAELWHSVVESTLQAVGVGSGRLAVAGHLSSGTVVELAQRLVGVGWHVESGAELMRRWRKYKPPAWLPRLEIAAEGVTAAMRRIAEALDGAGSEADQLTLDGAPLTIGRLRELAQLEFARRGLEQPEGNILAAGAAGGVPHNRGDSNHILRAGEPLVVDLFPRGEFFADCTRTFCVGAPPDGFVAAFDATRAALEAAHSMARPGIRGWDLQAATCDRFEAAGYATLRSEPTARAGYVHGLGHGVGFELHEYPSFREAAGEEGLLAVGDLLTLEPGLYDEAAGWGVRLEDLCYLGDDGLHNLTPLPLEWEPGAWADSE